MITLFSSYRHTDLNRVNPSLNPQDADTPKLNYSLSSAGDINGDGYGDVVVGAYTTDFGMGVNGSAMVFFGSSAGVSATPVWTAASEQATSNFGISVASAGDVNGDGFFDVIIGANFYSSGEVNEGAAYLYFGSPQGLSKTPSWSAEGGQENAFFGTSVSGAGDVNKDGYADVVVGAPYFDNGETNEGRVFVFYGSPNGLSKTPSWTAESNQPNAFYGKSVAGVGDTNNDGYFDVAIGSPQYDNGQNNEGRVFLYMGSIFGLQQSASWTGESNQVDANYGNSIAYAGDVNKDGFADMIVGCSRFDDGKSNQGKAYLYFGYSAGLAMYPDWTMVGDDSDANMGYSVSTAGDVNGDGYSDIVIGSYGYNNQEVPIGKVSVYYGSVKGILPDKEFHTPKNTLTQVRTGSCVGGGLDTNGDGYSDVLTGIEWLAGSSSPKGKVLILKGNTKGLSNEAQP